MTEIVKVQTEMFATNPSAHPTYLVYAKGRRNMRIQTLPRPVMKVMRGKLKAYFNATWSLSGWVVGARVADQEW